ncbi:acetyl-CoA synthetase-like protein [Clavulina sp. PMI_390]|nr:acetyl-CoA synthetase-like protein [Clavulina sp. PMI_390]
MAFGRLLAECVQADPHGKYALLAPFDNIDHSMGRSVEWVQLKEAVACAAHILNPLDEHGIPSNSGRVIAVLAAINFLIYQTLNLAIMQSGNVALPISHRNSAAAVVNLLRKTNCHDIIVGGGSAVHELLEAAKTQLAHDIPGYQLGVIPVPLVTKLYPHLGPTAVMSESMKEYPMPSDADDVNAIRCYIHSSGTTSLPKPIPITEKYLRHITEIPFVRDNVSPLAAAMGIPPFHMMGIFLHLATPLRNQRPILLWDVVNEGETAPIPTPETTMQAMRKFGATSTLVVPTFLVTWSRDEKSVEYMRTMDRIITGGAPLPQEIGNELVRHGVNLTILYGGTEFSNPSRLKRIHRTREEWDWLEFTEDYPARWEEQEDGLFELQIRESKDFRPAIFNTQTNDGPVYATNDLFARHPTKPNMYKIIGRLDDQVTLATGEKVNPTPIELAIVESPLVIAAVLLGRAKNQVAVLVQPAPGYEVDRNNPNELAHFRNLLWPHVEKVNTRSAGFAKIFKETIIPSVPSKPFAKTPKGTVQRKRTEDLYAAEIDETYAAIDEAKGEDNTPLPETWTSAALEPWILRVVEELLQHPVDPSKDFFDQGADSLTATFLRLRCSSLMQSFPNAAVSSKARLLDAQVAFAHPNVSLLAQHLISIANISGGRYSDAEEEHARAMDNLVKKYTAEFSDRVTTPPSVQRKVIQASEAIPTNLRSPKESVLITGTTGALGSAILLQLIQSDRFDRVWALNRLGPQGQRSLERQRASFIDKGIDPALLEHEKLRVVDTDTSADLLGVDHEVYQEISHSVTLIIHNAWRLDFNLTLQSFEPQIRGTRNLVALALSSTNAASLRFIFTSSVSVLQNWPNTSALEEPIKNPTVSVGTGYGESKYVAEKILEHFRDFAGLNTTSIRLGQLSGSENGSWATSGWFPILLKSSLALRCLPDSPGCVSWVPVDAAATAVLDAALTKTPQKVLHIYHPKPIPWRKVLEVATNAASVYSSGQSLRILPFSDWLEKLEARNVSDADKIPAVKLLPFFRDLAAGDAATLKLPVEERDQREALGLRRLATDKMQGISPTLANLAPMTSHDVQLWVDHWRMIGFLP